MFIGFGTEVRGLVSANGFFVRALFDFPPAVTKKVSLKKSANDRELRTLQFRAGQLLKVSCCGKQRDAHANHLTRVV